MLRPLLFFFFFFFNDTATTEIYTLSLHDALPIWPAQQGVARYLESEHLVAGDTRGRPLVIHARSEEHTSELQSQSNLVCRLLLEKKKKIIQMYFNVLRMSLRYIDEVDACMHIDAS